MSDKTGYCQKHPQHYLRGSWQPCPACTSDLRRRIAKARSTGRSDVSDAMTLVEQAAQAEITALKARVERLRDALASIGANTCCEKCQEAALVARAALAADLDAANG